MNAPINQLNLLPAPEPAKPEITTISPELQAIINRAEAEDKLWGPDDDAVIIPKQPAIAVYENLMGGVVIRQESPDGPDEDPVITVRPEHVPTLIAALKRWAR